MKVEIYEDLLFINEATDQFIKRIEQLRDNKVLTPHYAELRILAARMNCAELNGSILNKLVEPEMEAAYRLQQEFVKKTARLAALRDVKKRAKKRARLKES